MQDTPTEFKPAVPPSANAEPGKMPDESERDQISQNIDAVLDFYKREEQKVSHSQRFLERVSLFIRQPVVLDIILLFVVLWILASNTFR